MRLAMVRATLKGAKPLLDWRADKSDAVANQIVSWFEEIMKTTGNIDLRLGTTVHDVELVPSRDKTNRIQILAAEGETNEIVDVAIVAIGFGLALFYAL